jgi:integrase
LRLLFDENLSSRLVGALADQFPDSSHVNLVGLGRVGAFTLHDLRRTVRTGLAKLGTRPDIAERCLNHAQPGIIATYDTHHYVEEKRDALTQWANHLQALRDGK